MDNMDTRDQVVALAGSLFDRGTRWAAPATSACASPAGT